MYKISTYKSIGHYWEQLNKTINTRDERICEQNTMLKTAFFPQMIYRFNAFPIKIIQDIFKCENQQDKNSLNQFEKEQKGYTLLEIKT